MNPILPPTRSLTRLHRAAFLWPVLAGVVCSVAWTHAAKAPLFTLELRTDVKEVDVLYRGKPLLTYVTTEHPFKPYVKALYSLDGVNVLQDAPSDHLHHHGLMYGIKVNDTNFWEETPGCGYQRPGPELTRRVGKFGPGESGAELSQPIFWVAAKDAPDPAAAALLVEQRTLRITVDEKQREVAVEWLSEFTVGKGAPAVKLTGAGYHGLGVRFAEPFHQKAARTNAAAAAYSAEAKWDVKDAVWESVSHVLKNRPVAVTVFGDPANAGAHRFFSMLNPFTYLSATQGLEEKALDYAAGQHFRVRYLVTVHSGRPSSEQLSRRATRWLKP